jgi:N-acetylmuramoyl-L-alanine amidase
MRLSSQFAALCIGLWTAAAQSALGRFEHSSYNGTDYVRLDDWAHGNGYQLHWVIPKESVRVSTPGGSLQFTVDSRKMNLKGVNVWLAAPVALRSGSACIAHNDLTQTIEPLLFPGRNSTSRPLRNIVLDPGHGGKDPGNQEGRRQEKQYTLLFAKELAELLKKAGFKVSLTRTSDSFVDLSERPETARRRQADLFLSLHFNSADGAGAAAVKGAEVYCMTPAHASSTNARGEGAFAGTYPGNRFDHKNLLLAYQLQKALTTRAGSEDRGVKRARFAVLRSAEMPAVLIEAAFMTHPGDAMKIYESASRRTLAEAIVAGVLAYKTMVER